MKKAGIALAVMLATCAALAQADPVRADDARISRMGRTVAEADGSLRFGYPGVRLALAFTGASLSFDASSSGDSYLEVVIDQQPARIVRLSKASQTVTLSATGTGVHNVEILHRSEAWHGIVTVASFSVDGTLLAAPPLPDRKMLVLGDSVTCGEAVDRVAGEKKNPAWWNARESYGMLAASALGAQVHLVCHGGRGLVRSWNKRTDEANLGDFYELAIAAGANERWDHATYQPDLIVSAIGTNDFSPGILGRRQYVDAYVKLVRTLLRNHPKAQIVLTEGAILHGKPKAALSAYIAETVKRVGSARVHSARSEHHPGDASDGHPTKEQHAAMARELVPQLRKVTGW